VDKTIELLKQAEARIRKIRQDYELALQHFETGKKEFEVAFSLLSRNLNGMSGSSISFEKLTDTEKSVFKLIGDGLKGKEIAAKLGMSVKTFNNHRDNIRGKLKIRSAYELKEFAKRHHA